MGHVSQSWSGIAKPAECADMDNFRVHCPAGPSVLRIQLLACPSGLSSSEDPVSSICKKNRAFFWGTVASCFHHRNPCNNARKERRGIPRRGR